MSTHNFANADSHRIARIGRQTTKSDELTVIGRKQPSGERDVNASTTEAHTMAKQLSQSMHRCPIYTMY